MSVRLRPFPTFVIIGAEHSGVEWLRTRLAAHPQVYVSPHEIGFFDQRYHFGAEWYRTAFLGVTEQIVGEATSSYLAASQSTAIAARIDGLLPDARLVAMLRNPVDRAHAAFHHHQQHGHLLDVDGFVAALRRTAPSQDPLRLVANGRYATPLEPYIRRFGQRLLVITHEELACDPISTYRRVAAHVGADDEFLPEGVDRSPVSDGSPGPTGEEREQAYPLFSSDIKRLKKLLDRDLGAWEPGASPRVRHAVPGSRARAPERLPAPLFVGGTGRSGTTILARLLAAHSRVAEIPIEVRFHADNGGIPELWEGSLSLEEFCTRMRTFWYYRRRPNGQLRGLHMITGREPFETVLSSFAALYPQHPDMACRVLINGLLNPVARRAGKPCWVEMTPPNSAAADVLLRLFPRARLLNIVRDGRDVAASVLALQWGPQNFVEALEWWAQRVRLGAQAIARADSTRCLSIRFEDLVLTARQETYQRILCFVELPDEEQMQRYFEQRVTPEHANIGRWTASVPQQEIDLINEHYSRMLTQLEAEGVSPLPRHEAAALRTGAR